MHGKALIAVLLAAIATVVPVASSSPLVVKERINIPNGWSKVSQAPKDTIIELSLAIKHEDFNKLEETLYDISHPDSDRYGKHLSLEQVQELIAPHPDSVSCVENWLDSHNVQGGFSTAKDWVRINVPIHQAEKMLNTTYYLFKHGDSGNEVIRTQEYSLPQDLSEHIEMIAPTTYFGRPIAMRSPTTFQPLSDDLSSNIRSNHASMLSNSIPDSCKLQITPDCLKALYRINGYKPKALKKNKLGIAGYLEQYANNRDLNIFFSILDKADVGTSYKFIGVHGGINSQNISDAGVEANLDVQYGRALSFKTPTTYYVTGGRPPSHFPPGADNTNEPYLDWLHYVLHQKHVPQTITTSYGDDETTVPFSYATRVCKEFATLGARGVTLLFASGDNGVSSTDCNAVKAPFLPIFPASCPYVTAVGATQGVHPEIAVNTTVAGYYSGGGFSNYFKMPKYQKSTVRKYLSKIGKLSKGQFNPAGRAYPDVSAQGSNFVIVYQDVLGLVGGTSASSPTFAAIISLVNDRLISLGHSPLGFLNPFLYSKGYKGLNDILSGSNPGCGDPESSPGAPKNLGFRALRGWDPVTGFGTPNFPKFLKIATKAAK